MGEEPLYLADVGAGSAVAHVSVWLISSRNLLDPCTRAIDRPAAESYEVAPLYDRGRQQVAAMSGGMSARHSRERVDRTLITLAADNKPKGVTRS